MLRAANGLSITADGVGRAGLALSRAASAGLGDGFLLCAVTDAERKTRSAATMAAQCMNGASRVERFQSGEL
jgi:hypothetical protein